jgi:steroid delta-isomerase-like uncharacterized protein
MNSILATTSIKEIAEEYANKIWNIKEIDAIDTLVHNDVIIHSAIGDFHGRNHMQQVVRTWLNAFPDLHVSNDIVISENDLVSIQWRAKGTHTGEFKGLAPKGNQISYNGVTVYRIQNNQIVEYWAYINMQHLLEQLV